MPDISERDLFLGGDLDPISKERSGASTTYGPDNLVTHGVIVGMTGSGKTGLGMVLIEEVLSKGIPCILIDPKGDLTNLVLQFPDLAPADFQPWVDPQEAAKAGKSVEQLAAETASSWRDGLAGWGLDGGHIRRLRDGVRFTIYTPGSTSGVPLNLVGSLNAPADGADAEARQDEVLGFVSGLLAMAGIDADPLTSPEHILLTNLISWSWDQGNDLDLAGLLALLQNPPIRKLGVIDLDTFIPAKERMALLVRLNGLLASPSFQAWAQGPPLDIASMLHAPDGRPSAAIVTLSHLADEERQFVVTLLFSKLITWMRAQPGTSSLRALAYMDEVFGFVPPNGAPPAKKPILTVLKQARAFGVGLVLSTQNPVDIDYKALSNAGTWMVGRLQTERDKARLLEGMTAASGAVDVAELDRTLSGLGKRQFVLHSTSANQPKLFTTRWALSYLRGPLTREQIAAVTADAPERVLTTPRGQSNAAGTASSSGAADAALGDDESRVPPTIAEGVLAFHLDPAAPWAAEIGAVRDSRTLAAALVARVQLLFDDTKADVNQSDEWEAILHPLGDTADWDSSRQVDYDDRDLRSDGPSGVVYRLPEAPLAKAAFFRAAEKALVSHLRANQQLELLRNKALKLVQRPGEANDAFGLRCQAAAEAKMDDEAAVLRDRLARQADKVRDALEEAEAKAEDLRDQQRRRQAGSVMKAAGSLLSSFLGGRRSSKSLARTIGNATGNLTRQTSASLDTAERQIEQRHDELNRLEAELSDQLVELDRKWDAVAADIDTVRVALEAADITVKQLAVVWVPVA